MQGGSKDKLWEAAGFLSQSTWEPELLFGAFFCGVQKEEELVTK